MALSQQALRQNGLEPTSLGTKWLRIGWEVGCGGVGFRSHFCLKLRNRLPLERRCLPWGGGGARVLEPLSPRPWAPAVAAAAAEGEGLPEPFVYDLVNTAREVLAQPALDANRGEEVSPGAPAFSLFFLVFFSDRIFDGFFMLLA